MVDLIKCQIIMANLTNYKSQRPLSMVNLIKPWSFCWTFGLFNQMFGLSHGQKCHFSQTSQSKVTHIFHAPCL
jgi:hypothetical protein